jgi:hypothetical protein
VQDQNSLVMIVKILVTVELLSGVIGDRLGALQRVFNPKSCFCFMIDSGNIEVGKMEKSESSPSL